MTMFQGPTDDDALGKDGSNAQLDTKLIKFGVATEGAEAFINLEEQYNQIENLTVSVDKAMRGLINTMGQGENLSSGIRKNIADAIPAVIEMGGSLSNVTQINSDFTQALGRNVTLTSEQTEQLFAAEKISGKSTKELVDGFTDVGMSLKDIGVNMIAVREVANNLGVNALAVSREVVNNMAQLNRFNFKDGVEGLARMAAQSSVLRVSMEKVFSLAEDIMDPERAIELAGALQRLGASSQSLTDPLRLMDLAQNNVPQLQQELGKMFKQYTMFDEKTKSFKIMPGARLQLKAIADEMGIGIQEAERYALGAADIGKKLSEISFAGLDIDQDTRATIANMSTMGEGGEYTIKTETGEEMVLQDFLDKYKGNEKGLQEFLQRKQEDESKTYEDKMLEAQQTIAQLAKMQLDEYTKAQKLGEAAKFAMPSAAAGSKYGEELLSLNVSLAEKINRPIIDNFGPGSPLVTSFNQAGEGLKEAAKALKNEDYKKFFEIVGQETAGLTTDILKQVGKTVGGYSDDIPGMDTLKGKIATAVDKLSDEISEKFPGLVTKLDELKESFKDWKRDTKEGEEEEGRPKFEKEEEGRPKFEKEEEGRPKVEKEEGSKNTSQNNIRNEGEKITVPTNINVEQASIQIPTNTELNSEELNVTTNNLTNTAINETETQKTPINEIQQLPDLSSLIEEYLSLIGTNIGNYVTNFEQQTATTNQSNLDKSLTQNLSQQNQTTFGGSIAEVNSALQTNQNANSEFIQNQTTFGGSIAEVNSALQTNQNANSESIQNLNTTIQNSLVNQSDAITQFSETLNKNTSSEESNNSSINSLNSNLTASNINNESNQNTQTNLSEQKVTPTVNEFNVGATTQTPIEISKISPPTSIGNMSEFKGEMVYGGEIKVVHTPMEIIVSSKDGKMNGKEIGDALSDEIGKNNQLANRIGQALNKADLGTIKKPQKINESQFLNDRLFT